MRNSRGIDYIRTTALVIVLFVLFFEIIGCSNTKSLSNSKNLLSEERSSTQNQESLQGNTLGNLVGASYRDSVVAEKENWLYFISHDGDRSQYLTRTGLYRQETDQTTAKRLVYDYIECPQTSGDFIYYLNKQQLCRLNGKTEGEKQEIIAEGVDLYSIYDHWVYYWSKKDGCLYRLDLKDPAPPRRLAEFNDLDTLASRGDFILAVERNLQISSQKVDNTLNVWQLSPDGSAQDLLITIPCLGENYIQPYGNRIYYLQDNIIWSVDLGWKNKQQAYLPDSSKISSFIVYKNRIYTEEYPNNTYQISYLSLNLEGKDRKLLFAYQGPEGDNPDLNGVLEKMSIFGFNVAGDYLFHTGSSFYLSEILTTRIPIGGTAEGKTEEVFFNGAWRSIKDYVEEADRVLASKGLK